MATIGQFWREARLGPVTTTVFVRRLLLYLPLAVFTALQFNSGGIAGLLGAALRVPLYSFGLMILVGVVMAAGFRFVGLTFAEFPGILGWPGRWLILLADLLWLLEAGGETGQAQLRASKQGVARVQRSKAQQDFTEALRSGEAALVPSSLSVGRQSYSDPFVKDGKLVGRQGSQQVEIGAVRESLSGFEVVDANGGVLLEFDDQGRGKDGKVIAHPAQDSAASWAEITAGEPAAPRVPFRWALNGTLVHSVVAGVVLLSAAGLNGFTDGSVASNSGQREDAPTSTSGSMPEVDISALGQRHAFLDAFGPPALIVLRVPGEPQDAEYLRRVEAIVEAVRGVGGVAHVDSIASALRCGGGKGFLECSPIIDDPTIENQFTVGRLLISPDRDASYVLVYTGEISSAPVERVAKDALAAARSISADVTMHRRWKDPSSSAYPGTPTLLVGLFATDGGGRPDLNRCALDLVGALSASAAVLGVVSPSDVVSALSLQWMGASPAEASRKQIAQLLALFEMLEDKPLQRFVSEDGLSWQMEAWLLDSSRVEQMRRLVLGTTCQRVTVEVL